MKFLLANLFLLAAFYSYDASAQADLFVDEASVPDVITRIDAHVFDLKQVGGACADVSCFRMDIYLNGIHVARYITSPGQPHHRDYPGEYTPEWYMAPLNFSRIYDSTYKSYVQKDPMPWAVFIQDMGQGGGFAIHQSGTVNGRMASHGCLRLKAANAYQFNQWVREVKSNGGTGFLTTEHTDPNN